MDAKRCGELTAFVSVRLLIVYGANGILFYVLGLDTAVGVVTMVMVPCMLLLVIGTIVAHLPTNHRTKAPSKLQ